MAQEVSTNALGKERCARTAMCLGHAGKIAQCMDRFVKYSGHEVHCRAGRLNLVHVVTNMWHARVQVVEIKLVKEPTSVEALCKVRR